MKKTKQLFYVLITIMILLMPCYVMAEEESPSPTENPTPSEEPIKRGITLDQTSIELGTEKKTTLKATVTPSDSNLEIVWTSSNERIATVENGEVTTGTMAGETIITATIKGTDLSATCTVQVSRQPGKDATLKNLTIKNGKISPEFKSSVYEYTVTVDTKVSKLEFDYELSDRYAKYFGPADSDNKNLKNGDKLEIKVVADDEKTNHTYTLTIVKETTSLSLKSLKINGYELNESFDPEVLSYTASIPYEIDTITVVASPEDSKSSVDVSGISNLKIGNNLVKITVKDEEGNVKEYEITVTRESEVSIMENPTTIITSSNHDSKTSSNLTGNTGSSIGSDDFLKYVIVSIACLILLAIGGIGIYFYLKTSPKKLKRELKALKEEKEESPMIEISSIVEEDNKPFIPTIDEELLKTKEFDIRELEKRLEDNKTVNSNEKDV